MPRDPAPLALSTPEEVTANKRSNARNVVVCTPTTKRPFDAYLASMEACTAIEDRYQLRWTFTVGSAYISWARADALHRALQTDADTFVFIDHDMGFPPESLAKLIDTPGDVVAGVYRYKLDKVAYMGVLVGAGKLDLRADGCIRARWAPAGFLKVTRHAVRAFMRHHPELCFGMAERPHIDLFNHGARNWCWYGEDYSFTDRWCEMGGDVWVQPDIQLDHYDADGKCYPGHFRDYLLNDVGTGE